MVSELLNAMYFLYMNFLCHPFVYLSALSSGNMLSDFMEHVYPVLHPLTPAAMRNSPCVPSNLSLLIVWGCKQFIGTQRQRHLPLN